MSKSYWNGKDAAHLRQVTEMVKQDIWSAGGVPAEFGRPEQEGGAMQPW